MPPQLAVIRYKILQLLNIARTKGHAKITLLTEQFGQQLILQQHAQINVSAQQKRDQVGQVVKVHVQIHLMGHTA